MFLLILVTLNVYEFWPCFNWDTVYMSYTTLNILSSVTHTKLTFQPWQWNYLLRKLWSNNVFSCYTAFNSDIITIVAQAMIELSSFVFETRCISNAALHATVMWFTVIHHNAAHVVSCCKARRVPLSNCVLVLFDTVNLFAYSYFLYWYEHRWSCHKARSVA